MAHRCRWLADPTDGYLVEEAERSMSNSLLQFVTADDSVTIGWPHEHHLDIRADAESTVFPRDDQVVKRARSHSSARSFRC